MPVKDRMPSVSSVAVTESPTFHDSSAIALKTQVPGPSVSMVNVGASYTLPV